MRIYNLLVHGKLYEQIPVHERVLPIVEGVLDPGCLVSFLSSISIDPGERASAHAEDVKIYGMTNSFRKGGGLVDAPGRRRGGEG